MEGIYTPDKNFDFEKIILTPPISVSNGNHFIKFIMNENPLYIQTPKCKIKQGMIKTSKKIYCDLMFTIENEEFIQWIENIENYSQKYIYEKREKWFETNLEKDDIDNSFASCLKPYKSGKYYILRVNIPLVLGKINMKIYDEDENIVDIENIDENNNIISVIEVLGIKCSVKGFQIDMEMKQLLVFKKENIFDKCILHHKNKIYDENKIKINDNLEIQQTPEPILENSQTINDDNNFIDSCNTLEMELNNNPDESQINLLQNCAEENTQNNIEKNDENTSIEIIKKLDNTDLFEIDFNLDKIPQQDTLNIKKRNDVFYKMYKDAMKKAKMAKDLALTSYLEAKHIKNTHLLDDVSDESDFDEEILDQI